MSQQGTMLRHMERFRCIGGECEDTCCADWTIGVDRPAYDTIMAAYAGSDGAPVLVRAEAESDGVPTGQGYAKLHMRADGRCPLLTTDGLCDIHSRFGPTLLPPTCATYPRSYADRGLGLELSGYLSCPEVARGALLADDGVDEVALSPELVFGLAVGWQAPAAPTPWEAAAPHIRRLLRAELDRAPSLTRGLVRLVALGYATRDYFNADCGAEDVERLAAELPSLLSASARLDADLLLARARRSWRPAAAAALELLRVTTSLGGSRPGQRLGALADRALTGLLGHEQRSSFTGPPDGAPSRDGVRAEAGLIESVAKACEAVERSLEPAQLERLDVVLRRLVGHHVFSTPTSASPDLMTYMSEVLSRVATVRLLALGLAGATAATVSSPGPLDRLDAAVVQATQRLSRTLDHDRQTLGHLRAQLWRASDGAVDNLSLIAAGCGV